MGKIKSRKLWVAAIGGLLLALNRKLGLDLDTPTVLAIAGIVVWYLTSQGFVDWKKAGEPGKERGEG